ncbi:hypothetical protein B6I21_07785 [candidate division KSB1 bacterium 4572_119]|nr:MAG: hypothetical protein B6I21_07785 [candidate division KSB1 bacterium 4572_119]
MKYYFIIILLFILLISGCSQVVHINRNSPASVLEQINITENIPKARILLDDGTDVVGKNVHVDYETTNWFEPKTNQSRKVPNFSVEKILQIKSPSPSLSIPKYMLGLYYPSTILFRSIVKTYDKEKEIKLASGIRVPGKYIQVGVDSVFWFEPLSGQKHIVQSSKVKQISILDREQGLKKGGLFGTIIGVSLGAFMGYAAGSDNWLSWETKAILLGLGLGPVGGGIASQLGKEKGSKTTYIFEPQKNSISKSSVQKE